MMLSGIEIVQICYQDPQCISDATIGVRQLIKHLFAKGHLIRVIHACDPKPHDIGSIFINEVFGLRRFSVSALLGLGKLLSALQVDNKRVSDNLPIRSLFVNGDARQ